MEDKLPKMWSALTILIVISVCHAQTGKNPGTGGKASAGCDDYA
jgi:hypothetical protein